MGTSTFKDDFGYRRCATESDTVLAAQGALTNTGLQNEFIHVFIAYQAYQCK
jgi:hypothetical protein